MMNKTLISLAVGSVISVAPLTVLNAAMPATAKLVLDPGGTAVTSCVLGTIDPVSGNCSFGGATNTGLNITGLVGSFFEMGPGAPFLANNDGLSIGTSQPASGSHSGSPNGTESPGIDTPWEFASNTGMHQTISNVTIDSDDGAGNVELGFSGWNVTWNGIAEINMGGGLQDCGTDIDGICVDNFGADVANIGGVPYDNGTGLATVTCATDCSAGDTFTLIYSALVPQADPSNFAGVGYALTLTGTIDLRDTTPDPFNFIPQTNVLISTLIESDVVTVTGMEPGDVDITISAGSEYKINGGTYTSSPGVIRNDDTVQVRHTSSASFSSPTATTLTIGGVDGTFTSTTEAEDTDSDVLVFATQGGVPVNTLLTSNTVAVTGINSAATISIDIGEYSIDGGAFVSVTGSVNNGQTVTIRHTSSALLNTDVVSTLTIGTTNSTFTSSTSAPDTVPDPFSFANDTQLNVALNTVLTSGATAAISGINTAAPISVANGEYSFDGTTYTSAAGTVNAGQTVEVRHTSASTVLTDTVTTLNIGGVTATFTSTTEAADTTPDAFTFTTQTDVARGSLVTSNSTTVTGINVSVNISVANGEYAIDSGAYTIVPGTVNPGQAVTVRHTATALALSDTVTTLTIGGIDGTFTSTTAANIAPVAVNDDGITIDVATALDVTIDVTANDTDADGTVDATSVVATNGAKGTTSFDPGTGLVTYTPDAGASGTDSFTYTVIDNDGDISNSATVTITVSNSNLGVLPADAFFILKTGNVTAANIKPPVGEGSWFSMEVVANEPTHTSIVGFNHIQLGIAQPASSKPLLPNIDQAWLFFGNLGVHQSTSALTIASDDGAGNVTLGFAGWNVSWNGIPSIPLGEGLDNGIATMTCFTNLISAAQGDCSPGDEFVLEYRATVPPGDVSGFGNVNYILHLEGVVSLEGASIGPAIPPSTDGIQAVNSDGTVLTVEAGDTAASLGNTSGVHISAVDLGIVDPLLNPNDGQQCIGGCVDFVVTGVTDYIDVVFKLDVVLPDGAIYRKLINGAWAGFNAETLDQVGSNNANATTGLCDDPSFQAGLRAGAQCLFLRIHDGGPNDADGLVNGVVVDPSGALLAGSSNTPASSTSGCSITGRPVSLFERADWLLITAFVILLAVRRRRKENSIR